MLDRFLRYKEIASLLGLSHSTIKRYRASGRLRFLKTVNGMPGCWLSDFIAWRNGGLK